MMKRIAAIAALAVLGSVSAFAGKPVRPEPPPGPLLVVDSTGKIAGRLGSSVDASGTRPYHVVFITIDGSLVAVRLQGQSNDVSKLSFWSGAPTFYFEGTDCQGVAYMYAGISGATVASGATPSVAGYEGNNTGRYLLYIASGPAVERTTFSSYSLGVCSPTGEARTMYFPLSSPIDLTAQYLQPFVIQ